MYPEIKKTVFINGHKIEVLITVTVQEGQDDFDALIDCDNQKEVMRMIDRGEIFAGSVFVTATALGLEGSDCLGGCSLVPNNAFNSAPFEASVKAVIDNHDMVENALADLTKAIQGQAKVLRAESKAALIKAKEFARFEVKRGEVSHETSN